MAREPAHRFGRRSVELSARLLRTRTELVAMNRHRYLLLAIVATVVAGLIVGWVGVLAASRSLWLPSAIEYLAVAIVCLSLLLFWTGRSGKFI